MALSTVGGRSLPDNLNIVQGASKDDLTAMLSAVRALSDFCTIGSAAPTHEPVNGGGIYIRTGGSSVASLYVNVTGTSVWAAMAPV